MTVRPQKRYPTIACCGLDCGLCPRYYTEGSSRCPGCAGPSFFDKHPSCSKITCCVKERGLEVCAECDEFPCEKYSPWLEMKGDQGGEYDSFLSYKKVPENLKFIKEYGVERYLELQKTRIDLLETMLESFNDGRSRSFYCIASTLLPTADIEAALEEAKRKIEDDNIPSEDQKSKAKILKMLLNEIASKHGTELKLRKKK